MADDWLLLYDMTDVISWRPVHVCKAADLKCCKASLLPLKLQLSHAQHRAILNCGSLSAQLRVNFLSYVHSGMRIAKCTH